MQGVLQHVRFITTRKLSHNKKVISQHVKNLKTCQISNTMQVNSQYSSYITTCVFGEGLLRLAVPVAQSI